MARSRTRREILAVVGAGVAASLAGCGEESSGTPSDVSQGRGATAWSLRRGTPGNTGESASGGPPPSASQEFSATLRDGISGFAPRPPVVGDDGIYAIALNASPYEHDPVYTAAYAYKLSRTGGAERWRVTVADVEGEGTFQQIKDTQAVLGPAAFYALHHDAENQVARITALSREDGTTLWEHSIPDTTDLRQPTVRDGTLYCLAGRSVVALDTADGSEQWRSPRIFYNQPVPTVGQDAVAVYNAGVGDSTGEGQLTVLNTGAGTVRWSEPFPNARTPIPAIAGDTVYLADGDANGGYGLEQEDPPLRKIHARSLADGSERWTHTYDTEATQRGLSGGTAFVTVTADHVYYALGSLTAREIAGRDASAEEVADVRDQLYKGPNVVALDRSDGSVVWRTTVGSHPRVFRPMVAGPENLYALYTGTEEEQARIAVIDRDEGAVRGGFGPITAKLRSFAVADGTVFTRDGDTVRAWQ